MSHVLILGTGGTIAGRAPAGHDNVGYQAAQIGVADLIAAVPALEGQALQAEQIAQIDSKDMSAAVWRRLALRVEQALADPAVRGIVITHGTDTLEETAWFLQAVLAPAKPVVLTAAMRPASSRDADGPRNLADAVTVARTAGARGVVAVVAGAVWRGDEVRKAHIYRLDAFDAGDAGPVAWIEEGCLRLLRDWPSGEPIGTACLTDQPWPAVEIVLNHADAGSRVVDALCAVGVDGLVVAGTGNGTLHDDLAAALERAQAAGVAVLRCSRINRGRLIAGRASPFEAAHAPTLVQARVELQLRLLQRRLQAQQQA